MNPCRRTMACIRAKAAITVSVRVGNVLRQRVGKDGDVGHLDITEIQRAFTKPVEQAEVRRLVELGQRWPRKGGITNGKTDNGDYRVENNVWEGLPEGGDW